MVSWNRHSGGVLRRARRGRRSESAAQRKPCWQLDQAIQLKTDDEIGQLAEALERMRISLKQALDRLRARRSAQQ